MTPLAWIAALGPIVGLASGIGIGFWMGVAHNAEEMGSLRAQLLELEQRVAQYAAEVAALSARPPSRSESRRVLDLVGADSSR